MFHWQDHTNPEDKKEERKVYIFCSKPSAKMMQLTEFKNGQYLLSCLGHTKRFERMPLDAVQKEATIWLMNILREIQSNLYSYVCDPIELPTLSL